MRKRHIIAGVLVAAVLVAILLFAVFYPTSEKEGGPQAREGNVSFTATPSNFRRRTFTFEIDESGKTDHKVEEFRWDLGDGRTAQGPRVEHTYDESGEYPVTLAVTDDQGNQQSTTRHIIVHDMPLPPENWSSLVAVEEPVLPLLTDIEPPEGAIVHGDNTWIRWQASVEETEGRILWHKKGEPTVRTNVATPSGRGSLTANVTGLESGSIYEYLVEQFFGDFVQRSGLRSFTVQGGVTFDPVVVEASINRDYDQTVSLRIRNDSDEEVTVAGLALRQIEDLPADVVGPGSADQPVQLPPGESLDLRLAVFAQDASRRQYEIPVEAAGATATARIEINEVNVQLDFEVMKQDAHTLARTIKIINRGDTLTDLAIHVPAEHARDVWIQPRASHASLPSDKSMVITVSPVLYLEFESLETELICQAAGQEVRHPLSFQAPPDQSLVGVRGGSKAIDKAKDTLCTNSLTLCTILGGRGNGTDPSVPGVQLPPDITSKSAQTAPIRPRDTQTTAATPKFSDRYGANLSARRTRTKALTNRPLHVQTASIGNALAQYDCCGSGLISFATLQAVDATRSSTGGDAAAKPPADEAEAPSGDGTDASSAGGVRPGGCHDAPCSRWQRAQYWSKAIEFADRLRKLEARIGRNRRREESLREKYESLPTVDPTLPQKAIELKDKKRRLARRLNRIVAEIDAFYKERRLLLEEYERLKKEAMEKCGMTLPVSHWHPESQPPLPKVALRELGEFLIDLGTRYKDNAFYNAVEEFCRFNAEELPVTIAPPFVETELKTFCEKRIFYPPDLSGLVLEMIGKNLVNFAANDPPSPTYAQGVEPQQHLFTISNEQVAEDALATRLTNAYGWYFGYLKAYMTSYERYQGADQANDPQSMALQAEAMLEFARSAFAMRRHAFILQQELDERFYGTIKPLLEVLLEHGGLQQYVTAHVRESDGPGLAHAVREKLVNAEVSPEIVGRLEQFVSQTDFSQVDAAAADLYGSVASGAVSTLDATNNPSETAELLQLSRAALGLLNRTDQLANHKGQASSIRLPTTGSAQAMYTLRRRAAFTREHRGALASAASDESPVGIGSAVAFYAADRIHFAWQSPDNAITLTTFHPGNESFDSVVQLGVGRRPQVVADGERLAVVWDAGDDCIVRVNAGEQWSDVMHLPGDRAEIALVPGNPLHIVSTVGLWKLTPQGFIQLDDTAREEPALDIDADGKPHIASIKNGRIFFDTEFVDAGEQPSLLITDDGTVYLAYVREGVVFVRVRREGEWREPQEIVSGGAPGSPTLARGTGDEIRLSYVADATRGPRATYVVRLPDGKPVLVPSLAGNVTDAWLSLRVDLHHLASGRSGSPPHDLLFTVNDAWVHMFDDTVPEGRYMFPLNPHQVFTSPGRPAPNRIGSYRWRGNRGAWTEVTDYRLYVKTAWSEHFGFSDDPSALLEAEVELGFTNYDKPDLTILANRLDLPNEAPAKPIDLPIVVANLGEADAPASRVVVLADDTELATAQVPLLRPDEQYVVKFVLDSELDKIEFRVEPPEDEFDAENNSMTLHLWAPWDYQRVRSERKEAPEVIVEQVPNDVYPPWIAGTLPDGAKAIGEWSWHFAPALHAPRSHSGGDEGGRVLHYFIRAEQTLPLAAGDNLVEYVYLDPQKPPKQILLQPYVEGRHGGTALYWGSEDEQNLIHLDDTPIKHMGPLPEAGKWVRLRIPVEAMGLSSGWIDGLLFGRFDGQAYWGTTTKSISRLDETPPVMAVE